MQVPQKKETTSAEKVYLLSVELAEAQDRKKSNAKTFNEEIKRIKAEIAALISEDKKTSDV